MALLYIYTLHVHMQAAYLHSNMNNIDALCLLIFLSILSSCLNSFLNSSRKAPQIISSPSTFKGSSAGVNYKDQHAISLFVIFTFVFEASCPFGIEIGEFYSNSFFQIKELRRLNQRRCFGCWLLFLQYIVGHPRLNIKRLRYLSDKLTLMGYRSICHHYEFDVASVVTLF